MLRVAVPYGLLSATQMRTLADIARRGDDVAAVDVRGNGVDQFLVLNGADTNNGPVQLIAAAP